MENKKQKLNKIIYVSNGALSQSYQPNLPRDAKMEVIAGDLGFEVHITLPSKNWYKLRNDFYNPYARFTGFYALRREDGKELWLNQKCKWQEDAADSDKYVFKAGHCIAGGEKFLKFDELVFVANWETYAKTKRDAGSRSICYCANGAAQEGYSDYFARNKINGEVLHYESGTYQLSAIQYVTGQSARIENHYHHPAGRFIGFYARKRTKDGWYWYTVEDTWQKASDKMAEKRLFPSGADIYSLFEGDTVQIVLDAQWRAMDGSGLPGREFRLFTNLFGARQKTKEAGGTIGCGCRMFTNRLMAHGLGGFEGQSHCNSKEAFLHSLKAGYRYFETDVFQTCDGRLVLYHGWFAPPEISRLTYDEMMSRDFDGHKLMDAAELYAIMKVHPQICMELDLYNYKGETIKKTIRELLRVFEYDKTVLDRLLVQVHSADMKNDIDSIYPFQCYQMICGKQMDKLGAFMDRCLDNGICAVAMRMNLAKERYVKALKASGLYILCFTVTQNTSVARKLLDSGVDTLCVDFITPKTLSVAVNKFGTHPFRVYYSSGLPGASETYSDMIKENKIKGKIKENKSGTIEFHDAALWKNDGTGKLLPNAFQIPGKHFVGWNLGVHVDKKKLWLCTDGCYHMYGDVKPDTSFQLCLFDEEFMIPKWKTLKNTKFFLTAVWEDDDM